MTHESVGPVVAGVVGGPGSAGALRYAMEEALRTGSGLRLLHVSPSYPPMSPMMPALPAEIASTGTAVLDQTRDEVARLAPDLRVDAVRHTGSRVAELVCGSEDARRSRTRSRGRSRRRGGSTRAPRGLAAHAHVEVGRR